SPCSKKYPLFGSKKCFWSLISGGTHAGSYLYIRAVHGTLMNSIIILSLVTFLISIFSDMAPPLTFVTSSFPALPLIIGEAPDRMSQCRARTGCPKSARRGGG